ncbi:hypothetical protein [Streptomyces doebereineriae]|uniref:Uncharacterized protein n=1 Tax=Streptomyces doebereineriae TaxID=3075528 RepID=A0ABU2V2Y6_9ACTN|nr:hypothetical protein [Streptomyces sp. DSM 41640]MDT0479743.1 hypothetical protein [Streptomyces sp. DSM 41640]
MQAYEVYRKAMTKDHWKGWWVNWPLSQLVRVGDVYDRQGDDIRRAGKLADHGVTFHAERGTSPGNFTYDSNHSVEVRYKASGTVPDAFSVLTQTDAGASVTFQRKNTAFVAYREIQQRMISDVRRLGNDLITLWWNGAWDNSLLVVTGVTYAAAGTVLSAASTGATAELKLSATAGAAGAFELADLALGASVVRRSALGAEWTGTDITPFYQVVRLRKTWLDKVVVDYGPRPPGHGAQAEALPSLMAEEIQDDPGAALALLDSEDQLPFPDSGDG